MKAILKNAFTCFVFMVGCNAVSSAQTLIRTMSVGLGFIDAPSSEISIPVTSAVYGSGRWAPTSGTVYFNAGAISGGITPEFLSGNLVTFPVNWTYNYVGDISGEADFYFSLVSGPGTDSSLPPNLEIRMIFNGTIRSLPEVSALYYFPQLINFRDRHLV